MSAQPSREELARMADMARLEAELAAARAEAAKLRLQLVERDLAAADAPAPPAPPVAVGGIEKEPTDVAAESLPAASSAKAGDTIAAPAAIKETRLSQPVSKRERPAQSKADA